MGSRKYYIPVWSARLSQHASVAAFCRHARHGLEEAEGGLHRRPLRDCLVDTDDMRFHVTPESKVALRIRDVQGRRALLFPTSFAWRQIAGRVKFGSSCLFDLLQGNNPYLLAENLNFLTGHLSPQRFLLRCYGDAVLRAFLPTQFCTQMDNLQLCRALRTVMGESFVSNNRVVELHLRYDKDAGGDMLIDLKFPEEVLTTLGEQYHFGLRLRASETGRYRHVTVTGLIDRLVCKNGIPTLLGDKRVSIPYYRKVCPEHEQFCDEVVDAVNAGMENIPKVREVYEERVNRLIADANKYPRIVDEKNARVALRFIVRRLGLSAINNEASLDGIMDAYREEKKDARPGMNSAWLLVNALTRYASHYLMQEDLHLAQTVQSAVFESLLSHRCITWAAVVNAVFGMDGVAAE